MCYVRYSNKDVNLWCALCSYRCILVHSGLMFMVLVKGNSDDHMCVCVCVSYGYDSTCVQVHRC
jgi:hypothetical protein